MLPPVHPHSIPKTSSLASFHEWIGTIILNYRYQINQPSQLFHPIWNLCCGCFTFHLPGLLFCIFHIFKPIATLAGLPIHRCRYVFTMDGWNVPLGLVLKQEGAWWFQRKNRLRMQNYDWNCWWKIWSCICIFRPKKWLHAAAVLTPRWRHSSTDAKA